MMQSVGEFRPTGSGMELTKVIASMPEARSTKHNEKTQGALRSERDNETEYEPGVTAALDRANRQMKMFDKRIDRSVHEVTKTVIYTVVDTKTDEVISEYPSKRVQDILANLMQMNGIVLDKRI
ncbi:MULTISPECIES: flagellar protein FlaG [unclassified Fusibacter]|uniref:flagellar protein FlaG n=1 Tax=unclassified Fusibacter TaxID=2624464 RepID=UPI001011D4C1|nr:MULTISPECIES: flagellar protein FlaG [unclassified Fusibacter]MCK8059826.1 flagellar protein FlaG [Fusibacter sp. A2]NPE21627.1 flagellar protein FlaG [Fusibacter sp. A1]RXV62033.1 hypothetical protein DWB64_07275 [Fusibacter sp. A1]